MKNIYYNTIVPGILEVLGEGWSLVPPAVHEDASIIDYRPISTIGFPLINVSPSKSAAQIGQEIVRRLLSKLEPIIADLEARKAADDAYRETVKAAALRIRVASGMYLWPDPAAPQNIHILVPRRHLSEPGNLYGKVHVYDKETRFDLRVPHELAEKIAAVIYEHERARLKQ